MKIRFSDSSKCQEPSHFFVCFLTFWNSYETRFSKPSREKSKNDMKKRKALLGGSFDSLFSAKRIGHISLVRFSVETCFQGRGLIRTFKVNLKTHTHFQGEEGSVQKFDPISSCGGLLKEINFTFHIIVKSIDFIQNYNLQS